jgi:hypothetical protein
MVIVWMFMLAPGPTHTTRTRMLGFILSFIVLPVIALYMSLMTHPTDLSPTLTVVAVLALGVALYFTLFRVEPLVPRKHLEFRTAVYTARPIWLAGGFVTGGIAVFFFVVPDSLGLLHSFWHLFISLSLNGFQEALFQVEPKSPTNHAEARGVAVPHVEPISIVLVEEEEEEETTTSRSLALRDFISHSVSL